MREEALYPADLDTADEAFITSTTRELSPVVRIDDRVIGSGTPGPITLDLLARYRRYALGNHARSSGAGLSHSVRGSGALQARRNSGDLTNPRSANASIGGHAQIRLRSPYGLSILATLGQNFASRRYGNG